MNVDVGVVLIAIIVFPIVVVSLCQILWFSAREWSISYSLKKRGVVTVGKIIARRDSYWGSMARHYATYQFHVGASRVNQRRFTNEQQVCVKHFNQLFEGQKVSISYLPRTQDVSRLAGEDADNAIRNEMTVASFIIMLFFPPFAIFWTAAFFIDQAKRK